MRGTFALMFASTALLAAADLAIADSGPAEALQQARSWGYQLQDIDIDALAARGCDILVIDYSRDGTASGEFSHAEVIGVRQGGSRRVVTLAYLNIGEAEDYRHYWRGEWGVQPPAWLGRENPDWPGNHHVRYWEDAWQELIFGSDGAYLDRILSAGFDGVYLDGVDAFAVHDRALRLPKRIDAMRRFVSQIADYARSRHPGFLVVAQNGEELLSDPDYRDTLDAFAKEDLFFGLRGDGLENPESEVRASRGLIEPYRLGGKRLLLAEYISDRSQIADARARAADLGALLFTGERELADAPHC